MTSLTHKQLGAAMTLCIVASAQAQVAYVSSEKDHALTIIDLKTQAVTGTVATCKRPRHMMRTHDGKQLIVACGDSGQADVINLATRKSVRLIDLGEDPEIFDLSPDGKTLYVSNEDDGELGIIDMASGKRTGDVRVGKEPEGVKVSPDGKRPRRFATTPDGAQLWVTNELDASVTVIDTAKLEVLGTIAPEVKGARKTDITPVGITITRDGKRAFVGLGQANHVAFVDVATRKVTDQVLVGKRAWGLGLDAAERTLYVVNGLSDDLTIVDVASAKPLKTVKVGRVPHSVMVVE